MQNRNILYKNPDDFFGVMESLPRQDHYSFAQRNMDSLLYILKNGVDQLSNLQRVLRNFYLYSECEEFLSQHRDLIRDGNMFSMISRFIRGSEIGTFIREQEAFWQAQMEQNNASEELSSEDSSNDEQVNVRPDKKACVTNASMFKPVNEVPPASVQQAESTKMTLRSGKAV